MIYADQQSLEINNCNAIKKWKLFLHATNFTPSLVNILTLK